MGGGGSTAATSIPTEVSDTWEAAARGYSGFAWDSGAAFSWSTATTPTTFVENPSIARWMFEKAATGKGGNPFEGVSTYVPDSELSDVDIRLGELETAVEAINPIVDVPGWIDVFEPDAEEDLPYLDVDAVIETVFARAQSLGDPVIAAAANAASQAVTDEVMAEAVAVYEKQARKVHTRALNRFTGPMSDINAVNSSAFAVGLSILESDFEDRIKEASNDLRLPMTQAAFGAFIQVYLNVVRDYLSSYSGAQKDKLTYMLGASQMVLGLTGDDLANQQKLTDITADVKRTKIIAKSEEYEKNLEIDAREILWDAEAMQRMGNVVSAGSGSIIALPTGPSRVQTALSGGLSGAALGAKVSGGNPFITAAGGVVGALAGSAV
ncbi:hypothetical protein HN911_11710 [Candidatus Bathyarchaeota archaeon]|nr:hypothetical protein [Candidatus Bathyarchaeota archaeon]